MRRHDPFSLGIELNEREIRLVLANVRGGKASVTRALAVPVPSGAVMNGVVLEPGTLTLALRRAVEAVGGASTAAAIGIAGEQSNFRSVTVPPCPDAELPALVASEIEHQGALNPGDPYGFFPLHPTGVEAEVMQTLTVVGVDASVAQTLVETLEGAGLGVSALEPIPLAMLRTATTGLPAGTAAFVLVIGRSSTEAAYFVGGALAAFRRLDVGTDGLVQTFAPYDDEYAGTVEGWSGIDHSASDRLALEAQRTMDYVQRADRAAAIDRVRIVCDDAAIAPLAGMLERRFGLPIEIVYAPAPEGEAPDARFAAAYGLAVRALNGGVAAPAVDLFTAGRIEARRVETKRYFFGSLLVASLSVAVGLAGCLMYDGQIAAVQRRVATVESQIATTKKATADALDAEAAEALRDAALRKEGVPMGALIDDVSSSLDPNVGLKLMTVGDDLSIKLEGEARDEAALVHTAEALKASPVLRNVAVDRFDRDVNDARATGGIKFEISGATVAADRVARKAKNMMTPDRYRLVGWLASGLCLAVSTSLLVSRHAALGAAAAEEGSAGADLAKARAEEEAVVRKPKDRSFTCAPRATTEETAFLTELRRRAHVCGVSIARWSSHATDYGNKDGGADPAKIALTGVTKVSCDLALTGPYPALRAFLADVWGSERLLNVAHVDWSRTDTGSELSLSLGRYLAPDSNAVKAAPKS